RADRRLDRRSVHALFQNELGGAANAVDGRNERRFRLGFLRSTRGDGFLALGFCRGAAADLGRRPMCPPPPFFAPCDTSIRHSSHGLRASDCGCTEFAIDSVRRGRWRAVWWCRTDICASLTRYWQRLQKMDRAHAASGFGRWRDHLGFVFYFSAFTE